MRLCSIALSLCAMILTPPVSAQWATHVEDDVFSGGKQARLGGDIDGGHGLIFDCDADSLSLSWIERSSEDSKVTPSDFTLVVKVDQSDVYRFTAISSVRNEKFWQVTTTDRDNILKLLTELKNAQSKILVGIQHVGYEGKWAGTASPAGSTRETERFIQACGLK